MQPDGVPASRLPLSPPDVEAARAEEAAALRDIDANFPPGDGKTRIMDALTGKRRHFFSVVDSDNAAWNARFERFYAARAKIGKEERRAASIAAARGWLAPVVVVLGTPPNGIAVVLRRQAVRPMNVIVLAPNATPETLGAAFAMFDQSRELTGDVLEDDQVLDIQAVASATGVDAKDRKRMDDLLVELRAAPARQVDGLGIVQAVDTHSGTLTPK